jgi:HTH domain
VARSERLLELIQVLRRHRRPVRGQTLAAELGVSLRTVYRDIQTPAAPAASCRSVTAKAGRCGAGDGIVDYSPTVSLAAKDRLQAFTSIGLVKDDLPDRHGAAFTRFVVT